VTDGMSDQPDEADDAQRTASCPPAAVDNAANASIEGYTVRDAVRRVWARLPTGSRAAMGALSGTDLQTLLMDVAESRASTVRPADLMRRWREDRLVRPADADPRAIAELEARLWRLLPEGVAGVELSPITPLGTCSALGSVSQNRVVTTMRTAEVVSDPTNALAIEAAARRNAGVASVHLAACHRVLRAQDFGPGWSQHFRLFALVSSARDAGSGRTEIELLRLHLGYWQRVLDGLPHRLEFTVFGDPVLGDRLRSADLRAVEDPRRERGRGYYTGAALRILLDGREVGDGGFTTWTALLRNDAKERCLISCVSTERLAVH
jgi:hypothetical protein